VFNVNFLMLYDSLQCHIHILKLIVLFNTSYKTSSVSYQHLNFKQGILFKVSIHITTYCTNVETIWAKVKATADLSLSLCFEFLLSEPLGVTLVQACLTDVKCRLLQLRLNLL